MVQIRRNHQRNEKQKSIVARLLIIVVLFAAGTILLHRFYTKGIQKNSPGHGTAADEVVNRTYLPSCEPRNYITIKDNFSSCIDSTSGNVAWFASEWRFNASNNTKDSIFLNGVRKYLTNQFPDHATIGYFTDSIFPEALKQINASMISDTFIYIAGPVYRHYDHRQAGKMASYVVAFDPEINFLAAFSQSLGSDGKLVWNKTTIDDLEIHFGLDFFHHYLPADVEKNIEMRR